MSSVKRVTGDPEPVAPDPAAELGVELTRAARVLTDGIETVAGAVHTALDAAIHNAKRPDGRSSRWAQHRAARREELIDAAIEAISHHGASVGMDQIAAVAKTSKPVIYRYFTDKTDLYRAVSQRVVGDTLTRLTEVAATDPPPREFLHAGVNTFLVLLEQNPELYRFVSQNPLSGVQADGTCTDFTFVVADLLTAQLSRHLSEGGLDPALAHPWSEAIVGFISAASLWWIDHRDAMTRQQLADYLSALLWGGAAGVYGSAGMPVDGRPAPGIFRRLAE